MKPTLAAALEERGFDTLTPVQQAVIAEEAVGADLLVSAQTGSGKTLGFGLAMAPTVLGEDDTFAPAAAPLALVIAPTRELALQVKRELSWLYAGAGAVVASCVGGMDMRDERRALARGAHIVVATPGRLRDHIMRNSIDLGEIRAVVLDEADEMLDLGFREDLEFILAALPESRQTLMFSATVPKAIATLAKTYQRDALRITTRSDDGQHADISYRALGVAERDVENAIINVLRFYEAPNAIVFANTRAMVNRLTTRLSNRGFSVVALSGELSQAERSHALQAMRDGRARVCVATDVAARGIDLPNLDLVVHAELPSNHETLLHRSGRTGRAGRKGVSVLIAPPKSRRKAERILSQGRLSAEWGDAPSADAVRAEDMARLLNDPAWQTPVEGADAELASELATRFSADQLAAAYVRLRGEQHSAPEELSDPDAPPAPREAFGPSQWFAVSGGRQQNAEPRRILPMLCKAGGLNREDVGAIRVQASESFVQIRESAVAGFLSTLGPAMTLEGDTTVRPADAPPPAGGPRGNGPRKPAPKPHRGSEARSGKPAPKGDAPERAAPAAKKANAAAPIDWNDAPAPRQRKPKPGAKGRPAKPDAPAKRAYEPSGAEPGVAPLKPKGPPPPKGKSNSKKNKARISAAKAAKKAPKSRRD
ncbi:DEAD/DEAH box helicase [Oceanibium sediminis]|uniref:DEAD/DEAH box helicase n=1 Tax=Oceanibium sediminis TaxID=2026339 RepID=UPI000DD36289|nr:DEAD/DEAH box helicase [Oceanibium sediminis]